jgi:uncharacterized protein
MKIVITADTHIPKKKQLPYKLLQEFERADLIIHAGDWSSVEVYHTLSSFAEVKGVYGNIDSDEVRGILPEKEIIEIKGYRIGIVHGHGEKKTTENRALEAFEGETLDIIVFGHSHIPMIKYYKKTLLINPGSPTDKRALPYYSYVNLSLHEGIKTEIIYFR